MIRIKFLCAGGTICMMPDGDVLRSPTSDTEFMEACAPSLRMFDGKVKIDYKYVTSKDSTNMLFSNWRELCLEIWQAALEQYDAVGITMGTNTLTHTATAASLALAGTDLENRMAPIPVIMTGAQNSIHEAGGDATFNLTNMVRTSMAAARLGIGNVLINFWNRVLLGPRTLKVSERQLPAMDSPSFPQVGSIDAFGVQLRADLLTPRTPVSVLGNRTPAAAWGPGVIMMKAFPGLEPTMLQDVLDTGRVQALVLESLGAGSVCTEGAYSLLPVIERASKNRIPFLIATQFPGGSVGGSHDEVALDAVNAGAIPCYDLTPPATVVKLQWGIGNHLCHTLDDWRTFMATNYAGEVTPPSSVA